MTVERRAESPRAILIAEPGVRRVVCFEQSSIIISRQTDWTTTGIEGRAPMSLDTALLIKQSTCLVLMDMAT
jgi:hypothetical protein